jgi:cation transport regulator
MPYKNISELPPPVKKLPEHAQHIYLKAFNAAWEEYREASKRRGPASREEVAFKVAWAAVKSKYKKDKDGNWQEKQ